MRVRIVLGTWEPAAMRQFPPTGSPQVTRDLTDVDMPYVPLGGDLVGIDPRGYRVVSRLFAIDTGPPPHADVIKATLLVVRISGPPQIVTAGMAPKLS